MEIRNRHIIMLLLFSFICLFSACERREVLPDYPGKNVLLNFNWPKSTQKSETIKVTFYSRNPKKRTFSEYLPSNGGIVRVPFGEYDIMLHSFDSESIHTRGEGQHTTLEAYTKEIISMSRAKELIVEAPDKFFVDKYEGFTVIDDGFENQTVDITLDLYPKDVLFEYKFRIELRNVQNIYNTSATISGFSQARLLHNGILSSSSVSIYFEPIVTYSKTKGVGYLEGRVLTFGRSTQITAQNEVTLNFRLKDGTLQVEKIDVTEQVRNNPSGGNLSLGSLIYINLIESTDSGFGGTVGDWGDEEDYEIDFGNKPNSNKK